MIGAHSYVVGGYVTKWGDPDEDVIVGKYCSIAEGCEIWIGGDHHMEFVTTFPFDTMPLPKKKVIIGHDVWIGAHVKIMGGVTIHSGACIGVGSVITRDVPPYSIYAGNPAGRVKVRFTDDQIDKLLQIAWWDWPHEKVLEAKQYLLCNDIDGFIRRYYGTDGK